MGPVPVICGPTAGGKSDLAVRVALALRERGQPAAVLAADAFQVYRGMDIGTAKPTPEERAGVEHLLIDIAEPAERFTASDWLTHAKRAIDGCRTRGVLPIVVGGTHLYVKLLLDGMFEGPGADERIRERLRAFPPEELRARLTRVDPAAAARIHPSDRRRTVRALEVFELTGRPISEQQREWDRAGSGEFQLIVLDWPSEALNPRINARVRAMMERGLLEEVRSLHGRGLLGPTAREALGYKQLVEHIEGRASLADAVERVKIETRRFAKNQRTWLRRLKTTPGCLTLEAPESPPGSWASLVPDAYSAPGQATRGRCPPSPARPPGA